MQTRQIITAILVGAVCSLAGSGCVEGRYRYEYRGTVLRSDGITPAEGIRMIPHPVSRNGIAGANFRSDDPNLVVSGAGGHFKGTMGGWHVVPLLFPFFSPRELRTNKVWVYLPMDAESKQWKAVVVPVRVRSGERSSAETTDNMRAVRLTGTIDDVRVVLPDWYTN